MSSIVEGTVGLVVKLMVAKRAWFQLEPSLVRSVSPGFDSRTVQQPTHIWLPATHRWFSGKINGCQASTRGPLAPGSIPGRCSLVER